VIWLLDRFPNIEYLVDLHSYGEMILHSWGSDENQSDDPQMNFRNPHFDGLRGRIHDDVYREYILAEDAKLAAHLGQQMADAIRRVRGRNYKVKPGVGLYPTSGSSDDYAYSRHLVNRHKGKIIAFLFEYGRAQDFSRCAGLSASSSGLVRGMDRDAKATRQQSTKTLPNKAISGEPNAEEEGNGSAAADSLRVMV
jgi:Zinc carboxypeptidase